MYSNLEDGKRLIKFLVKHRDIKTIDQISRETSRHVYFFIKQEGRVYQKLKSLKYKPSPIPSGGLEVPLLFKFEFQDKWITDTMKEFEENLYFFDFAGDLAVNDEDEEEIDFETLIQMRMMKVRLMRKMKKLSH